MILKLRYSTSRASSGLMLLRLGCSGCAATLPGIGILPSPRTQGFMRKPARESRCETAYWLKRLGTALSTAAIDAAITRVYDELYTSDAWSPAHDLLQKQPAEAGCKLERIIAGLCNVLVGFYALSNLYVFRQLVKIHPSSPKSNIRCLPSHGIYPGVVPNRIMDFIVSFTPRKSHRKPLITHCPRELMHEVWRLLLDVEFKHAYKHGIVIKCFDGIYRRVNPRIFTYSADYPEKVLLATVHDNGFCLCPRCLVEKKDVDQMGTERDLRARITGVRTFFWTKIQQARQAIYDTGFAIASDWVENILKPFSPVPTVVWLPGGDRFRPLLLHVQTKI
ncbi:hypothetical protein B0H12DRAFT_1074566 [Mycena haematopus]|nr:hypothetical protein B0H12DRAFT_1074566 [Mycena haematopus]